MKVIVFNDPHRGFNHKTSKIHDHVFSKLNQNDFDIVIVCGDWGSSQLKDVKNSFKAFRRAFPKKEILGVLGNHELWDKKIKSVQTKFKLINEYAENFKIHLLEKKPFEKDNVLFLGYNGWYYKHHPDTRDLDYMHHYVDGKFVDNYLNDLADSALNFMIDYPKENKKVVSVTHFPCIIDAIDIPHWNGNPSHGDVLLEFSDLILFGHTHAFFDQLIGKTRVLNVGSGYNQLLYKIVEI